MPATLEAIVAVLRVGEGHQKLGDPYEFAATVVIRGAVAEIVGGTGSLKARYRHDILDALRAAGVTNIVFDRMGRGAKKRREVSESSGQVPSIRLK